MSIGSIPANQLAHTEGIPCENFLNQSIRHTFKLTLKKCKYCQLYHKGHEVKANSGHCGLSLINRDVLCQIITNLKHL